MSRKTLSLVTPHKVSRACDLTSGPFVGDPEGEDCKGKVGEGKGEEQVDYSSSLEWVAPEGGTTRSQLRSEVHVVQHDGTSSDKV